MHESIESAIAGEMANAQARIVTDAEADRILGRAVAPLVYRGQIVPVGGSDGKLFDASYLSDWLTRREIGLRPPQPLPPA